MEDKSLIEIAIEWMQNQSKNKSYTIKEIAKKVFEKKGLKLSENKDLYAQFQMDFMLCGDFLSFSEDKDGNRLWNLKYRFKHEQVEKESAENYTNSNEDEAKEVREAELKDYVDENYIPGTESENPEESTEEDEDGEEGEEEMDDVEQTILESSEEADVEEDNYDDEE